MSLETAANLLTASILSMLAFVIICVGVLVINNILHKYWKPVRIFTADSWNFNPPAQFIHEPEIKEPK